MNMRQEIKVDAIAEDCEMTARSPTRTGSAARLALRLARGAIAETIGSENARVRIPGDGAQTLEQRIRTRLGIVRHHDDRRRIDRGGLLNDRRRHIHRRDDNRDIGRFWQFLQRLIGAAAKDFLRVAG